MFIHLPKEDGRIAATEAQLINAEGRLLVPVEQLPPLLPFGCYVEPMFCDNILPVDVIFTSYLEFISRVQKKVAYEMLQRLELVS